jgi:hypothetical protein
MDTRRLQNEKVTFWNNTFGVGNCISYSNDGKGRCWQGHFSASTHRIFRASRVDSDT